jgi:tetratricopeptide (TPR) repeat protein
VLAAIFALSFVVFGVGSEVPGGIADVLQRGGVEGPSASKARERLQEDPRDAAALRDLATALQNDGRPMEAIAPLETLVEVQPENLDALRELASLYTAQAAQARNRVQRIQLETQLVNPGALFLPSAASPFGQAYGNPPITEAVSGRANERLTRAYGDMQRAYTEAVAVYQRLAEAAPNDATVQIQLADAALNSGDSATALEAYKRFVELAPDDPSTPLVQQEIKRLEEATAPASEEPEDG